jgi:hypothetical protein
MTAAPIHYFVFAQKFSGLFCHTLQYAAYRTALAPFLAAAHMANMDMQRDARSRLLYDIIGPRNNSWHPGNTIPAKRNNDR